MRRIAFAKSSYHRFKNYFKFTLATLIIIACVKLFVLDFYRIPSVSMQPTLVKGDHVVALKIVYGAFLHLTPSRGDVVVVKTPGDTSYYVKRVIALPNELINMKASEVLVNGNKLKRIYDTDVKKYKYIDGDNVVLKEYAGKRSYSILQSNVQRIPDFPKPYSTPVNGLFLLGDNRSNSIDSRNWGDIDKKYVIGRAVFIWLSVDPDTHKIRWDRIGRIE